MKESFLKARFFFKRMLREELLQCKIWGYSRPFWCIDRFSFDMDLLVQEVKERFLEN